MKHFPVGLHFVLTAVALGLAVGAHAEGLRPLIQHGLNGLTIGLAVSIFVRILFEMVSD